MLLVTNTLLASTVRTLACKKGKQKKLGRCRFWIREAACHICISSYWLIISLFSQKSWCARRIASWAAQAVEFETFVCVLFHPVILLNVLYTWTWEDYSETFVSLIYLYLSLMCHTCITKYRKKRLGKIHVCEQHLGMYFWGFKREYTGIFVSVVLPLV